VLLLDEPFAGLSREERAAMKELIAGIPREVTVVMIEHDMDTALDLAERITVLFMTPSRIASSYLWVFASAVAGYSTRRLCRLGG